MLDSESAEYLCGLLDDLRDKTGARVVHILDASDLDGVTPEARKVFSDRMLGDDSPMEALAIVGADFFMRSLIKLYGRISTFAMKVFETQEEAINWLRKVRDGK